MIAILLFWAVVPVSAVMVALVVFLAYGYRSATEPFDAVRETQNLPDVSPAVAGMLWRHGRITEDDVIATLLDLVRRGVVTMDPERVPPELDGGRLRFGFPSAFLASGQTYRMTLRRDRLNGVPPWEVELLRFVFAGAPDRDSVTIAEYRRRLRVMQWSGFLPWLHRWRRMVRSSPEAGGLLRPDAVPACSFMESFAVVILPFVSVIALMLLVVMSPAAAVILLPLYAGAIALSWWVMLRLPGPTTKGAELLAHFRALRRRLKATRIAEMPPPGLLMWDQYFIFSVAFGMARKTIADLYVKTPNWLQRLGVEVGSTSPRDGDGTRYWIGGIDILVGASEGHYGDGTDSSVRQGPRGWRAMLEEDLESAAANKALEQTRRSEVQDRGVNSRSSTPGR